MKKQITLSEVQRKDMRIIGFLIVSGVLGLSLAWILKRPELALVLAPATNYILYRIEQELKGNGYRNAKK